MKKTGEIMGVDMLLLDDQVFVSLNDYCSWTNYSKILIRFVIRFDSTRKIRIFVILRSRSNTKMQYPLPLLFVQVVSAKTGVQRDRTISKEHQDSVHMEKETSELRKEVDITQFLLEDIMRMVEHEYTMRVKGISGSSKELR
ncbi:hypothetical protein YC2023_043217 [Brassica napus]